MLTANQTTIHPPTEQQNDHTEQNHPPPPPPPPPPPLIQPHHHLNLYNHHHHHHYHMNQHQNQLQNHASHQLAIIQPSFNSTRNHSIASLIKQKRNALSLAASSTNPSLPIRTNPRSRQHTRILSPICPKITSNSSTPTSTSDDFPSTSDLLSSSHLHPRPSDNQNDKSHINSCQKSSSRRPPPSFVNLISITSSPLDMSEPCLSQVVMTPTTEEWWSFGGLSHMPSTTKSGLSSPITSSSQPPAQAEESIQDQDDEEEEEEEDDDDDEGEDQVDDQSDHTGSSSSGSYQRTQPQPSSSTTTTPDSTLEAFDHHHPKLIPNPPSNPGLPSYSQPDFSTGLISTEPEPTQALPTLTSVHGIINVPSSSVENSTLSATESHVSFPTLTAMSSYSVGRASQYPHLPLTSTALLSSLLDKSPPSAASRPCSLLHDGTVRKSIDPRSYSAMTGHRDLDSFVIHSTAGSGAYGVVKHAQEKGPDGQPVGPPLVIKYIVKQRILADCWKRHKVLGPIPVEIHVLDHLRRVNSRPSIITMARKFIQNGSSNGKSTTVETIPSRVKLIEFFNKQEDLADTHDENNHQLTPPHQQRTGHPNICGILDHFEDSDYYYLVMPRFGHGKDLFEHIETAPDGLPREEVKRIFGQIVDGVAYLHERNIVHRDLKDENVILDGNGNAQLIDFGSAAYVREGSKFETFSGTLDFAAPEVLKGVPHGGKEIDIWALGVILYVLIAGECPFWNPEEASQGIGSTTRSRSKLEEHLYKKSNVSDDKDHVGDSEAILDLLDHCLNLDPEKRPSVEIICWHKFFLPEAGWIGRKIPKIGSCSAFHLDPPSSTNATSANTT